MGAIFDLLIIAVIVGVIRSKIKKRKGYAKPKNPGVQPVMNVKKADNSRKAVNERVQHRVVVKDNVSDDEYASEKSYKTEEAPYKQKKQFKEVDHDSAYVSSADKVDFSQLEKAVVMAEILGKPVSMKRRNF